MNSRSKTLARSSLFKGDLDYQAAHVRSTALAAGVSAQAEPRQGGSRRG
jgi:hypothetical protein